MICFLKQLSDGLCCQLASCPPILFSLPFRCAVGSDWWYYGDSCQFKGSVRDKTTLALASSLSVLGVMVVVTVVSVVCLKKKYKQRNDHTIRAEVLNSHKM